MWKLKVYDNEEILLTAESRFLQELEYIVKKTYGMRKRQTAKWSEDATYQWDNGAPIENRVYATISIPPEFWD